MRHIFGSGANRDNFMDDLGYTAIAGQIADIL
jgi:hypothetical protein